MNTDSIPSGRAVSVAATNLSQCGRVEASPFTDSRQLADDEAAEQRMRDRWDLTSPEATAARRNRIAAAQQSNSTRLSALCAARAIRRKHEVLTLWELQTELNSLIYAMRCGGGSEMEDWRQKLVDVACDLETTLYNDSPDAPLSIASLLERATAEREEGRGVSA